LNSTLAKIKMPGVIGTGWAISFLGSLPGGSIALTILQIAAVKGFWAGIFFTLGDLMIEMLFVRLLLIGLGWLEGQKKLLRLLDGISGVVLLLLAYGSFRAALYPDTESQILLNNNFHPFVFGIALRTAIPTLIPYWLGICVLLFSNGTLVRKASCYNRFVIGLGLGTFSAHFCYVVGGLIAQDLIMEWQVAVQWLLGSFFGVMGMMQLRKVLLK
jgi:threonine/homoserine/homoserine lactone efflux protein